MIFQIVDIFYPNVFKRFSSKYNIYRDLYEKDLLALEIRDIDYRFSQKVKKIILNNKEICYTTSKSDKSTVDLLSIGSLGIFKDLAKEIIALGNEDIGFKITKLLNNITNYDSHSFHVGNQEYSLSQSYILGILNVTPDSFSDGGKYYSIEKAVEHGLQLIDNGADFLDVGGESTRPGSETISETEEINRVLPVIEKILEIKPEAKISIDTQKSKVAFECLKRGVLIVNDISSFENDPEMLNVVKEFNATYILMHKKGTPKDMQENPYYDDVVSEIYYYLLKKVEKVKKHGLRNIIIDPGIGFGKRVMDNYELLKRLNEFKGIGQPIMVGLSKKSFLGKALNLDINQREDLTLAAETIAVKNGAKIIRTHNVIKAKNAIMVNKFVENPELVSNV